MPELTEAEKRELREELHRPLRAGIGGSKYNALYTYFNENISESAVAYLVERVIRAIDDDAYRGKLLAVDVDLNEFKDDPLEGMSLQELKRLYREVQDFRRQDNKIESKIEELVADAIESEASEEGLAGIMEEMREMRQMSAQQPRINIDELSDDEIAILREKFDQEARERGVVEDEQSVKQPEQEPGLEDAVGELSEDEREELEEEIEEEIERREEVEGEEETVEVEESPLTPVEPGVERLRPTATIPDTLQEPDAEIDEEMREVEANG